MNKTRESPMEQRKHICGTDEIRVHVKDGSELKYWAQKICGFQE